MEFREWLDGGIGSREDASGFELYYTGGEAKGSLYAERDRSNSDLYRVTRVWAKPEGMGHGKKLYMAALGMASKRGGMLAPARNSTSDSASNVWRSLYRSAGVERVPLGSKDWPETPRNNSMLKKYAGLRLSDPKTHPPASDAEFWTFNSGYRLGPSQKAQISLVGASFASAGSRMGSGSKTPSGASAGVQDDGLTLDIL